MSPATSVAFIVTAYNRQQYFAEAIESVLRMEEGIDSVDHLLLRNFEDTTVDPQLVARGVRLIPNYSPDVGGTLYSALDHTDAEFLAFVDDDDLVLPHRLRRFAEIRERIPDLAYYHNGFAAFSTVPPPRMSPADRSVGRRSTGRPSFRTYRAGDGEGFLRFLAQRSQEQNLSSTIVHRSVIERARPEFAELPAMTDTAMLVAGVASGAPLVFDEEISTLVRRHRENVSRTLRDTQRRAVALDIFSRLIARTPDLGVARDYLELRRARETVYNRVLGAPGSSEETLQAARTLLGYWKRLRAWRDLGFLELAATSLVVPPVVPALRPLLVPR